MGAKNLHLFVIAQRLRRENRIRELLGKRLHRRGRKRQATAAGGLRCTRINRDDLVSVTSKRAQRRDGKLRRPHEDDSHQLPV